MASIPPSGLDLRVTFPKIKIKEAKVEHFCVPQKAFYHIRGSICQGKFGLSLPDFLKPSRDEKVETILAGLPAGRQASLRTLECGRRAGSSSRQTLR